MKVIKKLALLFIFGLMIYIYIYISNKDNKIYYLSLGDSLAEGFNSNGKIGYGYGDYVRDYINSKEKLEFYTKKFAKSGYRTIDLINDIQSNKSIEFDNKKIYIKNAISKSDIITL